MGCVWNESEADQQNGASGTSDIEHVVIGNRAGRRLRSQGSLAQARGSASDQRKARRRGTSVCWQRVSFKETKKTKNETNGSTFRATWFTSLSSVKKCSVGRTSIRPLTCALRPLFHRQIPDEACIYTHDGPSGITYHDSLFRIPCPHDPPGADSPLAAGNG